MPYERPHIQRMAGYEPGEQPPAGPVVKLNTNENPYPPPAPLLKRMQDFPSEGLRRYPDPTASEFRALAASIHGLKPENVIATNGGDELLRLAVTTFVAPGKPIGYLEPSYSLVPVLAQIHDSPLVSVELGPGWLPPADLAERLNGSGVGLTILVNPHAPSGALLDVARLKAIAATLKGVLLVDEAYVDFVDPQRAYDSTQLVRSMENVLILRSLSKGYSLAGLRFGYGLGASGLIAPMLTKTKDSYNTDALSQALAAEALRHRDLARETWQAVQSQRSRLERDLSALGLACAPSQSNFLLATIPPNPGAAALYQSLKQSNILVRWFNQPRLTDKLRITIGTPQQNDALLKALLAILK